MNTKYALWSWFKTRPMEFKNLDELFSVSKNIIGEIWFSRLISLEYLKSIENEEVVYQLIAFFKNPTEWKVVGYLTGPVEELKLNTFTTYVSKFRFHSKNENIAPIEFDSKEELINHPFLNEIINHSDFYRLSIDSTHYCCMSGNLLPWYERSNPLPWDLIVEFDNNNYSEVLGYIVTAYGLGIGPQISSSELFLEHENWENNFWGKKSLNLINYDVIGDDSDFLKPSIIEIKNYFNRKKFKESYIKKITGKQRKDI